MKLEETRNFSGSALSAGGALFTRVVTSRTLEPFAKSFILEG